MSANVGDHAGEDEGIDPVTLAAGGLVVGAAAVTLLGVTGVMPLTFTADNAVIAGFTVPWFVPVIALGVIATAVAYTLGIMGIARLRPRFASLVGLSEVLFAVLAAWVLLGEGMTATQAVGGAVVLAGLALARAGDRSEQLTGVTWPDGPVETVPAQQGVRGS
jgi:drug/metabolite transporter (DMT)-like permease